MDAQKLWTYPDGRHGLYKRRKWTYEKLPTDDWWLRKRPRYQTCGTAKSKATESPIIAVGLTGVISSLLPSKPGAFGIRGGGLFLPGEDLPLVVLTRQIHLVESYASALGALSFQLIIDFHQNILFLTDLMTVILLQNGMSMDKKGKKKD